jgi:hypothetical protein
MAEVEVVRHAHRGRAKVRLRVTIEGASAAAAARVAHDPAQLDWRESCDASLGPDQWLI